MDEKTQEHIGRLKERIITACDGPIACGCALSAIIYEAREKALAEASTILKDLMLQAILERALAELEGTPIPVGSMSSVSETSLPATQAETFPQQVAGSAEEEEEIRREIDAIRKRMPENERLLQQIKAPAKEPRELEMEDGADIPGEGEEEYGYYVHGIIEGDGGQPKLPKEGIDPDHPVYTLSHQGIGALVSKVSLREFGQEALKALVTSIEIAERMRRAAADRYLVARGKCE